MEASPAGTVATSTWIPTPVRPCVTASAQSRPVASRAVLEVEVARLEAAHPESEGGPPLPPFWGGYRLAPDAIEFWQGRINRLHDRLRYVRDGEGWRLERLAP